MVKMIVMIAAWYFFMPSGLFVIIACRFYLLLPLTECAILLTPAFSPAIRIAIISFVGLFTDLVDTAFQFYFEPIVLLQSILRPIVLATTNFCLSIVYRIGLEFIGLKEAPEFTFYFPSDSFEHYSRTHFLLRNSVKSWLFNDDLALSSVEYEPETSETSLSCNYEKSKELPWSIVYSTIETNVIERPDLGTRRPEPCDLPPKMVLN